MNGHRSILAPLDQPPVEALPSDEMTTLQVLICGWSCKTAMDFDAAVTVIDSTLPAAKKGNPETAKGLTDPLGLTITIARPKLKTMGHVGPDYVQNNVVR